MHWAAFPDTGDGAEDGEDGARELLGVQAEGAGVPGTLGFHPNFTSSVTLPSPGLVSASSEPEEQAGCFVRTARFNRPNFCSPHSLPAAVGVTGRWICGYKSEGFFPSLQLQLLKVRIS